MLSQEHRDLLRVALSRLYDESSRARALCERAGISSSLHPGWSTPTDFWTLVLSRLEKGAGKDLADWPTRLLRLAAEEYPRDQTIAVLTAGMSPGPLMDEQRIEPPTSSPPGSINVLTVGPTGEHRIFALTPRRTPEHVVAFWATLLDPWPRTEDGSQRAVWVLVSAAGDSNLRGLVPNIPLVEQAVDGDTTLIVQWAASIGPMIHSLTPRAGSPALPPDDWSTLRDALAELFDDLAAARVMCGRAGIPGARLPGWSTARDFWTLLLAECRKGAGPADWSTRLLQSAAEDYPRHPAIAAMMGASNPTELDGQPEAAGGVRGATSAAPHVASSVPNDDLDIPGDKLGTLVELLATTFTGSGLEQFIRVEMNYGPDRVPFASNIKQAAYELAETARRQGDLRRLIRALVQARPRRADIASFAETLGVST